LEEGGGDRRGLREQSFRNVKYERLLIWNGGRSLQLKKAYFRVGEGEVLSNTKKKALKCFMHRNTCY
jgi:hypothetical protein